MVTGSAPPEIAEQNATGATAEHYADIRHVTQRPVINLLFRTLAAAPGALDWSWRVVRPAYQSGVLDQAGATLSLAGDLSDSRDLSDARDLGDTPPLTLAPSALISAEVDAPALTTIRTIFAHYNASNRQTIIAVMLLQRALDQPVQLATRAGAAARMTTPSYALPTLLNVDQLPPDLRRLLNTLSGRLSKDQAVIVPGIYRHLAHWPGFVELIAKQLEPLLDDGTISRCIASIERQAENEIALSIEPLPVESLANQQGITRDIYDAVSAITAAFRHKVAEMLVIGLLIEAALPPDTP